MILNIFRNDRSQLEDKAFTGLYHFLDVVTGSRELLPSGTTVHQPQYLPLCKWGLK